ncbi:Cytochrome b5-like heme/steroid binding domain [Trinorchestia longiramus]|nr:Cytochrome b5-like heme/steroid binding domain [Trinorchestia longiramus]
MPAREACNASQVFCFEGVELHGPIFEAPIKVKQEEEEEEVFGSRFTLQPAWLLNLGNNSLTVFPKSDCFSEIEVFWRIPLHQEPVSSSLLTEDPTNAMANKKSSMVNSLTSLLKQVHLFNYDTSSNLEEPASVSMDSCLGFSPVSSSASIASEDSLQSDVPRFQDIPYSKPQFSLDSGYGQAHISNSLDSYTDFSDKSDAEDQFDDCYPVRSRREPKAEPTLPEFNLNEVAQHDMMHDCWIVLYDKVYDVTQFLFEHPGGEDLLMEHAGRDATIAFRGVGHSKAALHSLQQYLVGQLPASERIFSSWEIQ